MLLQACLCVSLLLWGVVSAQAQVFAGCNWAAPVTTQPVGVPLTFHLCVANDSGGSIQSIRVTQNGVAREEHADYVENTGTHTVYRIRPITLSSGAQNFTFQAGRNGWLNGQWATFWSPQSPTLTLNSGSTPPPPPPPCTFSLAVPSSPIPAAGGSVSIPVTASRSDCAWSLGNASTWLHLSATSGTGTSTVTATAAMNTATSSRSALLGFGGTQTWTVTQAGASAPPPPPPCTVRFTSTHASLPQTGGAGTTAVEPSSTPCAWSISVADTWLTVAPLTGTAYSVIDFASGENTGVDRITRLTLGSEMFTVDQNGPAPVPEPVCTYTVSPSAISFGSSAQATTVTVTTQTGCAWTVTDTEGWLSESPMNGSGSGSVRVTVNRHNGRRSRTASLTIAGIAVPVEQRGR